MISNHYFLVSGKFCPNTPRGMWGEKQNPGDAQRPGPQSKNKQGVVSTVTATSTWMPQDCQIILICFQTGITIIMLAFFPQVCCDISQHKRIYKIMQLRPRSSRGRRSGGFGINFEISWLWLFL